MDILDTALNIMRLEKLPRTLEFNLTVFSSLIVAIAFVAAADRKT